MEKKNQRTSSVVKTKRADSVTIAENPNQNGIELRFNAEPSHELQSKLRARGFRPSKSQSMWYGDNNETNQAFALEVESILPTSPEGPDLFLSPSFEAVKTNIEQRDFSFILITLKDGEIKSYIVFEPSKPKAEVIATQFAKKEFRENFVALAVKPRLQLREARVLFDEGKIIFPEGQKLPTYKESSIKGWQKENVGQSSNEIAETQHSTGKSLMQPYSSIYTKLLKVIPDLVKHIQEGKYHGKSEKDPKSGFMNLNYDYVGKDKKGNYVIALSHYFEQNGDLVADPDMQIRILPELEAAEAMTYQDQFGYQEVYPDKADGKEYVDVNKKKDLNRFLNQWLSNLIHQGHHIDLSKQESELEDENESLKPTENPPGVKSDFERVYTPEEEKEIAEQFLAQGYKRPFSARDAFDQQLPVIDLAFRYDEPLEYFRENIEEPGSKKILKLRKELKELSGKGTNEKRSLLKQEIEKLEGEINIAEKLIQDETLIFNDDLFQIIVDKAKEKGYDNHIQEDINRFRDYVTSSVLDNRAIENYHRQPVNEVVDELIEKYFNSDENTSHVKSPSNTDVKSTATDLKSGDTFIPNVLVPAGTTEPFYSRIFNLYDMKEVIKNNFPHLLKINDSNLTNASPIALFELMQFGHPSEYGIDVSRTELIKEFENRGKSIFKTIGFPTDAIYPYVNLHTGYESVESLNEMLFDKSKNGDEWWAVAEHYRPVADAKKGLKIIDQMIEKEKQEMKAYINPKTGKPKLESKHLIRDIELTIESFEDSKAVLQHYLDNPLAGAAENPEEIISDPLANESGVFTEKTAGKNYKEIEIPIPKAAGYEASISIAKTSSGDYSYGLRAEKQFGDKEGASYAPKISNEAFASEKEALEAALKEHEQRLQLLLKAKDHSLSNESKKQTMLNAAMAALHKFAEAEEISLKKVKPTEKDIQFLHVSPELLGLPKEKNVTSKIPLKEIQLVTFPNDRKHRSETRTVHTWKDADEYFRKKKWVDETVQLKVIWQDFETFERRLEYSHAHLYSGKNPISEFVYQANLTLSKMKPLQGSPFKDKDVKKAQKLIAEYSFSDEKEARAATHIIKELESAYWTKEDDKYPQDKAIINGMEFDQARLRQAIRDKLLKLSLVTLQEITDELSYKFDEKKPLESYEKGIVTIGKSGDQRKATLIAIYVDDMIVKNDIWEKKDYPVMNFLFDLLFSDSQKLVDFPMKEKENKKPSLTVKKQSQHELNKEIETFIDKKDKEDSSFNEEEKNYIRQYTGSGGLLKEGATGRGALYEYYTPELVVKKMWDMAKHYGYDGGPILEPAVGTGNFLKVLPKDVKVVGFETNHYAARIAQVLYPHAEIHEKAFETLFFSGNIHLKDEFENPGYSLVIGNPPYGEFTGKYAGMGEKQYTGASEYDQYFILRGLDLLKKGGLLAMLIPSSFMSNKSKFNKVKEKVAEKSDFVDSFRLPTRLFETTDIGTDILVLRKNK